LVGAILSWCPKTWPIYIVCSIFSLNISSNYFSKRIYFIPRHKRRYISLLQKLEDSVLRDKDTEDYTVRGEGDRSSKIPARIREIITKNLAADERKPLTMSTPTPQQLSEENRLLSSELNRVEDLLAASRAERDELGIKYNALSEKVTAFVNWNMFRLIWSMDFEIQKKQFNY